MTRHQTSTVSAQPGHAPPRSRPSSRRRWASDTTALNQDGFAAAGGAQCALAAVAGPRVTAVVADRLPPRPASAASQQALNALSDHQRGGRAIAALECGLDQLLQCGVLRVADRASTPKAGAGCSSASSGRAVRRPADRRRCGPTSTATVTDAQRGGSPGRGRTRTWPTLRHDVAADPLSTKAVTTAKRDEPCRRPSRRPSASSGDDQRHALESANVHGLPRRAPDIGTLADVPRAASRTPWAQITAGNNDQAAKDISAVSGPCTQLDGGASCRASFTPSTSRTPLSSSSGRRTTPTRPTRWRATSRSSSPLTGRTGPWSAARCRACPPGRSPDYTWAPSVAMHRRELRPVLRGQRRPAAGSECISVATATRPQGPFVDTVDRAARVPAGARGLHRPGLVHRPQRRPVPAVEVRQPGSSKIWSEQLNGTGTAFAPPHGPAHAGTALGGRGQCEAPDLVAVGGRYLLFFSGDNRNGANYAVGVATCSGPIRDLYPFVHQPDSLERSRRGESGANRCSPTPAGPAGSPSTAGSPVPSVSRTAVTSTSSRSPSRASAPVVSTAG